MKSPRVFRSSLGVATLGFSLLLTPATAETTQRSSESDWQLVWADEFEGPEIDLSNWTLEVMPDPFNEELQFYTDRRDDQEEANAWIEEGRLIIEARAEVFEHRSYTSARLISQGKREFIYGRFEARIRQPSGVGLWPAFWLLGGNIGEVGWPACGEIDILEGKGRLSDWTSGALHRGPAPADNLITSWEHELDSGSFHETWHRFRVDWSPQTLRWYVDDQAIFDFEKPQDVDPSFWPFDHGHPFFIILNLAVGGWFDKDHPPPADMSPSRLEVDYVRVYRQREKDLHLPATD